MKLFELIRKKHTRAFKRKCYRNNRTTETTRKTTKSNRTTKMTLQPSNLLHLCDDIQWKIGKEIKFKRIEEDAKKRKTFMNMCMGNSVNLYSNVGKNVKLYNDCIRYQFAEEIFDKIHAGGVYNENDAFFVKTMNDFYLEIKARIQFYHIGDELKIRKFYKECVKTMNVFYLDFYTDSDED